MKAILVLLALLSLSGCYEDKMREQMAKNGCVPNGREELAERVYCGKACFRPRVREWFLCGEEHKTPVWFDY